MTESFLFVVLMALGFTYAGMTGLCFAMNRHFGQVWHKRSIPRWLQHGLRALSSILLLLALVPCIHYWGPTIGWVVWAGFLSLAALMVAGFLPYVPRLTLGFALLLLVISLLILTGV